MYKQLNILPGCQVANALYRLMNAGIIASAILKLFSGLALKILSRNYLLQLQNASEVLSDN